MDSDDEVAVTTGQGEDLRLPDPSTGAKADNTAISAEVPQPAEGDTPAPSDRSVDAGVPERNAPQNAVDAVCLPPQSADPHAPEGHHGGEGPASTPARRWPDPSAFVAELYGNAGKKLELRKTDVDDLNQVLLERVDESGVRWREEVERCSQRDPDLSVPPRLLAAISRVGAERSRVGAFAGDVVRVAMHKNLTLATAQLGPPRRGDLTEAWIDRTVAHLADVDASAELTENTVTSLVLLLSVDERWSMDRSIRALARRIWVDKSKRSQRSIPLGLLAESRTHEQFGTIAGAFLTEVRQAQQAVSTAEDGTQQAIRRLEIAEAERDQVLSRQEVLEVQLKELKESITAVESDLRSERESHRVSSTHAENDFEVLRARVLRTIDEQTLMLDDALHAVRNGVTDVTEEFVERVIQVLRREADALRGR